MTEQPLATPSPFHPGEVTIQASLGVAEQMAQFGRRVIRDFMPDQHREFYAQLPFIVLGTVDPAGDVWATMLAGAPGFMHSPDPRTLEFALVPDPRDPAVVGLGEGAAVGLLGIELHTRRRNRMNGTVLRKGAAGFAVSVEHAFGNCPQYIQLRDWEMVRDPADHAGVAEVDFDDPRVRAIVAAADTFFVSSFVDDGGGRHVDASHRGGKPGFVRINDDSSLTIPDFAGNLHFNTLGNFLLNPHAGLVFPDFGTGDLLQLTGDAEVVLDSPEIAAFQGAERLWTFRPRRAVLREAALPLRLALQAEGWSPNCLMTGSWNEAAQRLEAESLRRQWRTLRVSRIVEESSVIRSLYLEPVDGAGLALHQPGQHLPIRVKPAGNNAPTIRTYTLSSAPSDGIYRLSVKRQGLVSDHLHRLAEGDLIEARAPAGASPSIRLHRARRCCWLPGSGSRRSSRCCARSFLKVCASVGSVPRPCSTQRATGPSGPSMPSWLRWLRKAEVPFVWCGCWKMSATRVRVSIMRPRGGSMPICCAASSLSMPMTSTFAGHHLSCRDCMIN